MPNPMTSGLVLLLGVGVVTGGTGPARPDPPAAPKTTVRTLDGPPDEIARHLRDLTHADVERRKAAAATLAKLDDAEPYLRHYRGTADGKSDWFAGDALDELRTRRYARERVAEWSKAGRFDLLVDLSLYLPAKQADEVAEEFFRLRTAAGAVSGKYADGKLATAIGESMKEFAQRKLYRAHELARPVVTGTVDHGFVRAESFETESPSSGCWLILTRGRLTGAHPKLCEWRHSVIVHNADLQLDWLVSSLVVCDGDIEFHRSARAERSTVIARGSIHSDQRLGFQGSSFYAGGDIVAKESGTTEGALFAAGKIDIPGGGDSKYRVEKAGVTENPYGVRFFETADVGAEAAMKGDALTVTALTPGSPLTRYGVEVGDVVTRVNEKPIKTAQDFRRELRHSVALEAGIFHLRRGDRQLTRIVYFRNGLEK